MGADDGDDDGSSSDEDFDQLPEEAEPSDELSDSLATKKSEAAEKIESGDLAGALALYTDVISRGGASALTLTKRAELLLKLRRPLAAVQDCTNAVAINCELGKAHRVRGIAHRKLGRWAEAKRDLAEGQRLDFDESVGHVQKFVETKARKAAKKRKQEGGDDSDAKRPK